MSRELDRRDFSVNKVTSERRQALVAAAEAASRALPGAHRIRIKGFDPVTGNPSGLVSKTPPPAKGEYVQRALDHVASIRQAMGLSPTQPLEFRADPNVHATTSGAVAVHLQQQYKAIDVFEAAQMVRFWPDGLLADTSGTTVSVPDDVPLARKLSAADASLLASRWVAAPEEHERRDQFGEPLVLPVIDLGGWTPRVIAAFPSRPDVPTVLGPGPFADAIKAALIWFPLADGLRLAWHLVLSLPGYAGQYRVIVDAESGDILYCHQMIEAVQAVGSVYRVHGGMPRERVRFPQAPGDYPVPTPADLGAGFPGDWVQSDATAGNCSRAHLGDDGPALSGQVKGGVLTFDPPDGAGDEQKILNIFYYTCFMHDYFYLLGFREADQNFQLDNLGLGGAGDDAVDARAYPGAVWATASMYTQSDGTSPVMRMGLVTSTKRHTAFDASVVFHEYTHGVTHRLVGGAGNDHALEAPQSAGMNEGWSDYIACTLLGTTAVGAWVVDKPTGVRQFAYDESFPDTFEKIGTGRYNEPHNIGEIWCATLMELGRKIGTTLGVQLVVDAWKLTPANPSFLDGRDAIMATLDAELSNGRLSAADHDTTAAAMWKVFARFGMGPNAQSNGASLQGVVADFSTPSAAPSKGQGAWADWLRVGDGPPRCVLTVAIPSPDLLELFVVRSDGGIYGTSRQGSGGAWAGWQRVGTGGHRLPTGSVIAAAAAANRRDLFIVADDGGVYTASRQGAGAWSDWQRIGATTDRAPAGSRPTAVTSANRIDLFLVAGDGGIYSTSRQGAGAWADWQRIGAATDRAPLGTVVSAASAGANRADVFLVAGDGGVYSTFRQGAGAWADWYRIGAGSDRAPLRSVVSAVSAAPDRIDLFLVAADGGIYSTSRRGAGAWADWARVGTSKDRAPLGTVVTAASPSPDRIELCIVGGDGGIYGTSRDGGGAWADWYRIGTGADRALPQSEIAAASPKPGRLDLFVSTGDGGIGSTWREQPS